MKKSFIISILFVYLLCSAVIASEEEILIIFDASLSMAEDISGGAKYIIAAEAAKKKLGELGNSKKIGLRTIGITLDENAINYISDPSSMCRATKLAVPVKQNNTDSIGNVLDKLTPLGVTPLFYSLKTSLENDFSQTALKHIILITDGGESCGGDPCGYISKIMQTRSDIKIDIVAIGIENNDFDQLQCITKAANGNIYNVKSKSEISRAFDVLIPVAGNISKPEDKNYEQEPRNNSLNEYFPVPEHYKDSSSNISPSEIKNYKRENNNIGGNFKIFHEVPSYSTEKSGIIYKNYTIEVNN